MNKKARIFIAGHRGMVGSALMRRFNSAGYTHLVVRTHQELDLLNQSAVFDFLAAEKPDWVIVAAAKVGGILANNIYRGQFIYENLTIESNLIHGAHQAGIDNLLFLGSSCIYPRDCPQPMKEEYLLTGPLETTNEPYAIAKIAGIKLCENYYYQYGHNYFSVMPTNLYGPHDNYDLKNSHVLPALLRKIHLAKCLVDNSWNTIRSDLNRLPVENIDGTATEEKILATFQKHGIIDGQLTLWGTGSPYREFLHVDDLADACVYLMGKIQAKDIHSEGISHLNIGTGKDVTIRELAEMIREIVGFKGKIKWDATKPDGTPKKLLDVSRVEKMGWKDTIILHNGIRQIITERGWLQ
ncbi:MAG: GDP-L-fucose synthase [FCB group bacterium]|nr:GDP-L-fucose synthase [FCB group bacterium]